MRGGGRTLYGQVAPEDVDNHPNGDPKGRDPCKLVERLRKKRVDLHAFRIEPSTDRMWAALKSAYKCWDGTSSDTAGKAAADGAEAVIKAH